MRSEIEKADDFTALFVVWFKSPKVGTQGLKRVVKTLETFFRVNAFFGVTNAHTKGKCIFRYSGARFKQKVLWSRIVTSQLELREGFDNQQTRLYELLKLARGFKGRLKSFPKECTNHSPAALGLTNMVLNLMTGEYLLAAPPPTPGAPPGGEWNLRQYFSSCFCSSMMQSSSRRT